MGASNNYHCNYPESFQCYSLVAPSTSSSFQLVPVRSRWLQHVLACSSLLHVVPAHSLFQYVRLHSQVLFKDFEKTFFCSTHLWVHLEPLLLLDARLMNVKVYISNIKLHDQTQEYKNVVPLLFEKTTISVLLL